LFEELVLNGIIKTYPKVRLNEFLGDISYTGSALKSKVGGKEPNPGGGDVRRAIQEYCILPMSSSYLRENSPHIKSCLLVGPEGSGKTMLINAICTELEATLFDLTATNIVGRYPGKSGLNMLLHLVIKVSRLLQPAVVFIDQCEKTFLKKVSKTDKSDPKRLKKDLPRLVRSLASEDCVMLIGTSRCPWECEQKGLTLTYQKMLVLPVPDYSFRYCLWKELIFAKGGQITKYSDRFDTSSLTKVSEGYTAGHIAAAVNATLTERRILQQKMRPLQPVEFIAFLAKCEPIYREEEEAFVQWYAKTPTGKKRFKFLEGDDEEGKKEKKSGKKKKK
jgi:SpoVK/Ycf46/Vps4 family AAA+-type ATPase